MRASPAAPPAAPVDGRPGTLRRRLFLIVMAAALAAMAASLGGLFVYETLRYRQVGLADLRSQADLVSTSLTPTLMFNDARAATEALGTLKARPNILAAAVFLQDGTGFAFYRSTNAGERLVPERVPTLGTTSSASALALARSITSDGESIGTLFIVTEHDLLARMGRYAAILLAAALPGLALSALIFRRLHPAITRPILAIEQASRRVTQERRYDIVVTETADGEIGHLIEAFNSMVRDLSAQMREREAAEGALREADRRKDEFLATLAHELRNPLAPIANAVALLTLAQGRPDLQASSAAIIKRQITHMTRLIDDLLEVSRITRGKLELRIEMVDLLPLVRVAYEAAEPTLRQRSHEVSLELPAQAVHVRGDAARLVQVIVNLLTNAAKYTPAGGQVALSVAREADEAAITVQDNGIGIAPEYQQRVFDMFYQVDQSLERGTAGLGVGLTIAAQLIDMHGGRLELQSAGVGRGSTFTVRLPLVQSPGAAPLPADRPPAMNAAQGIDVLVVDDNADHAESFAAVLQTAGHHVHTARDGHSALSIVAKHWPRVAFLDVGMPGMSGLELARLVRQRADGRPITLVAVTGWGQAADRQRVMEAGFDLHWVKPIDPRQALQLLEEHAQA